MEQSSILSDKHDSSVARQNLSASKTARDCKSVSNVVPRVCGDVINQP